MAFSYVTPKQILKKLRSFVENMIVRISEKKIEEKILRNEDTFGRGIKLKKIF